MRIALCISGQPRTWKRCYQSWFDSISYLGDIDTFYHMWDYNSHPNFAVGITKKELNEYPVDKEELDEIYETLKPKNHQVESKIIFQPQKAVYPVASWSLPQFYGIKKCAFLKREYEIKHNFEYDMVIRLRTDLVLNGHVLIPDNLKPNTVYTCMNHHDPKYMTFRVADVFYAADSYTYDQMSNFYYALDHIDARYITRQDLVYPPELAFYYYMKTLGLSNHNIFVDCKVARTESYMALKGKLDDYEVL